MAKIADMQEVRIELLKPYKQNAKIHGEEQLRMLMRSIEEFGFLSPCLVERGTYNLIAGHGRVEAAKRLGMKTVPCVFVEDITEDQRRAYILADNRLTELGEWDMGLVSRELEALKEQKFDIEVTGFTFDDITTEDIDFSDLDEQAEEIERQLPEKSKIKQGDLFTLGNHMLLCGDSTSAEQIGLLVRYGGVADCLLTDPPYNVDVSNEAGDKIANDNMPMDEFYYFLLNSFKNAYSAMRNGASFYVWHADSNGQVFRNTLEEAGLHIRQNIIWVKNNFTLGRQDYQWRHEPCLYGWKEGAAHYFVDDRGKATVFEKPVNIDNLSETEAKDLLRKFYRESETNTTVQHFNKPIKADLHPTMKPVALIERLIINSTRDGETVLDLFGGSGTTLIACENLNRKCNIVEYDPHYCDVIIQRWETLTGEKAVKVNE